MSSSPDDNWPSARQCRICLGDDNPQDLISPCRCSGTASSVHRDCLDHWRATKRDGLAFSHCGVCQFQYVIEPVPETEEAKRAEDCRRFRFRLFVARDTLGMFLLVQLVIIVLGLLVNSMDVNNSLRDMFPTWVSDHTKTTYYICGFVLFFAILGILGLCSACCNNQGGHVHDPCGGCYGCYFGDCRGSGGGGDDAKACLVILVVLVVILAFVGIFVGIFLASLFVQKIVQRHMKVLWLKQETKKFVVRDFHGRRDEMPLDNVPRAPEAELVFSREDANGALPSPLLGRAYAASAPPLSDLEFGAQGYAAPRGAKDLYQQV